MPKLLKTVLLISALLILSSTMLSAEESLTITTYYPSPYGIYRELRSQRLAVGENYIQHDTVCWEGDPINCDRYAPLSGQTVIPTASDTDLIVEGKVGIGTAEPGGTSVQLLEMKTTDGGQLRFGTTGGIVEVGNLLDGAGYGWKMSYDPSGNFALHRRLGSPSYVADPVLYALRSNGNVGIGTTAPQLPAPGPGGTPTTGNLDVNDVYIRSASNWVSQGMGFNKETDVSVASDQNTTGTSWVNVTNVSKTFTVKTNKLCIIKCRVAAYFRGSSATITEAGFRLIDDLGNVLAIKTGWYYGVKIEELDFTGFLTAGTRTVRLQFRGDDQGYQCSAMGSLGPTVLTVYD